MATVEQRLEAIEKKQTAMQEQVSAVIKHINNELAKLNRRSSNQAIRKIAKETYVKYETDLGVLTKDAQSILRAMNEKAKALTLEDASGAIRDGK